MPSGTHWARFKCLGLLLILSLRTPAVPDAQAQGRTIPISVSKDCDSTRTSVPSLGQDSVGFLPLWVPMRALKELCPTAYDTAIVGPGQIRGKSSYPGVVFRFAGLHAIALQYSDTSLALDKPPSGWVISGGAGPFASGATMSSTWIALSNRLGRFQASAGDVLVVRFCSLPRILFSMNVDPKTVLDDRGHIAESLVPRSATIHHIFIMSESLARPFAPCS